MTSLFFRFAIIFLSMGMTLASGAAAGADIIARLPVDINSSFCQGTQTWEEWPEYHAQLLRLAASYSEIDVRIEPVCMDYPTELRRISLLQNSTNINIAFLGTSPVREEKLLAVHFPIFLGTTGLRLFMAHQDVLPRLKNVETLGDLKQFTFGQGLGWPDTDILKRNDLSVVDGRYLKLHKMLSLHRFDLYPRAYWQIENEYQWMSLTTPNIVINTDIALYYPQPIYFFVSPDASELHDALLNGLEHAHKVGAVHRLLKTNPQTASSFRNIDPAALKLIYLDTAGHTPETWSAMGKFSLLSEQRLEHPTDAVIGTD